ncbi:MAG: hypothetical protein HOW97_02790 [Catenulispora sp.]|nr:hypothetical protein [Catenulispora sp.]
MKYVDLDATVNGQSGVISPTAYLAELPNLDLPTEAHAFATDPNHYDFYSQRCVKDLQLEATRFNDEALDLHFRHNCWKHEEDLHIAYRGVSSLILATDPEESWLGNTVVLDEILPHPLGCSHEIGFRTGTLTIICRDLTATWVPANCPDQPTSRS